MKNELIAVGIIFMGICFSLQSLEYNQELKRIHKLVEVERTAKIEAIEAKIELFPVNKGTINGNIYSIEAKEYEDEVILTKIGSK